ncbi:unnamed protein product [Ectocarpus sp. 12 AP-2014]
MLSAVENLQGQPASPLGNALPAGSMEGTEKESGGCSNGDEGSLRQDQESGGGKECGCVVAGAEGEERTLVHPGMQRSSPFPCESPPTPPTSMYATTGAGAGACADTAAPGTRPGSLRPSVSGLLAGHSSGIFSRQREDRADSLGDRYKGTNAFRRQHQQHAARTSTTRNAGYGAGDRYGERSGTRRPSHQLGAAERAGSSSTAKSGAFVIGSLQGGGGGGGGAERPTEREGRHGGGNGAGRRRDRRVVDRGREWEATAKEKGLGEDGGERRKQNGRVAQIADGLIWVQKHPVLAAVIWMCGKVLDPGSDDKSTDAAAADATAAEGQSTPEESYGRRKGLGHQFSSGNSDGESDAGAVDSMDPDMAGGLWRGSSGDFEKGRPVPPGFWRRHSKGRLSWSDDYQGGCLAEYYEDERSRMVSESSSVPPGDTNVLTSAESSSAAAAREEGGGATGSRADSCIVQSCRSQGERSSTAAASSDPITPKQPKKGCEPPVLFMGQDEDGEVFHSALQLADEDDDLEGLDGGCAALVRRDTFYGDVQEKLEDRSVRVSAAKGGSGGGAAASSLGGESAKHEQSEGSGCRGGQGGGAAAGDTGVAAGSGGGTGTPTAGTSPGTWSPQWGWYVTMTPPQDQYPAQQFPIPGAKPPTPTVSTAASDVPTSAKGRPPRP